MNFHHSHGTCLIHGLILKLYEILLESSQSKLIEFPWFLTVQHAQDTQSSHPRRPGRHSLVQANHERILLPRHIAPWPIKLQNLVQKVSKISLQIHNLIGFYWQTSIQLFRGSCPTRSIPAQVPLVQRAMTALVALGRLVLRQGIEDPCRWWLRCIWVGKPRPSKGRRLSLKKLFGLFGFETNSQDYCPLMGLLWSTQPLLHLEIPPNLEVVRRQPNDLSRHPRLMRCHHPRSGPWPPPPVATRLNSHLSTIHRHQFFWVVLFTWDLTHIIQDFAVVPLIIFQTQSTWGVWPLWDVGITWYDMV